MPWLFLPVDQILAHGVADRFVVGIGTLASGAFHLEVEHVHGIADRHIPRVPVKHAFGMVVPGWHGRRLDFQRFKARRAATDAQSQAAPGVLLRLAGLDKLAVDEALDQSAQHEHLQLHRWDGATGQGRVCWSPGPATDKTPRWGARLKRYASPLSCWRSARTSSLAASSRTTVSSR